MLQFVLDLLFPIHCAGCRSLGNHICKKCFSQLRHELRHTCIVCRKANILGVTHRACKKRYGVDAHISILHYNPILKRVLSSVKYHGARDAYAALLWALQPALKKALERWSECGLIQKDCVICPIPLHPKRQKARGFNQSEDLARVLANITGLEVHNLLLRSTNTAQLARMPHDGSRRQHIKHAFSPTQSQRSRAVSTVILIDDVVTTGATVEEASRTLKQSGNATHVYVLSLARG